MNDAASDFVRGKIAERVKDPKVAARLMPRDHPMGTKRICVDTDYFETYNRDNVQLVERSMRKSSRSRPKASGRATRTTGRRHRLRHWLRRDDGRAPVDRHPQRSLRSAQRLARRSQDLSRADGRRPAQPLHPHRAGQPVGAVQHDQLERAPRGVGRRDAGPYAPGGAHPHRSHTRVARWWHASNKVADGTALPSCNSWYIGRNIPGKPRVFMPYVGFNYRGKVRDAVAQGYQGLRAGVKRPSGSPGSGRPQTG